MMKMIAIWYLDRLDKLSKIYRVLLTEAEWCIYALVN